MKQLIEKRSVKVVLVFIVILIWGSNMISMIDMAEDTPAPAAEPVSGSGSEWDLPEERRYTYSVRFRDPFEPAVPAEKKVPPSAVEKEEIALPAMTLRGVIEETAQIDTPARQTYFVTAGDSVEGAVVYSVARDSVILSYRSEIFTIKLN